MQAQKAGAMGRAGWLRWDYTISGRKPDALARDVVMVSAHRNVEVDFVADNPRPLLFHCHMQLHVDYGFMILVRYDDDPAAMPARRSHDCKGLSARRQARMLDD